MQSEQDMIRACLRIRMVEEEIARRYQEGRMRTPVHLSVGQEAPAVGVCAALGPRDQCVSTHRSHAHYLAKGGSLNALIAELYGRESGCSRGHGGSMHLVDRSVGFMGSTSIVGGTIPVGVGLAFAKKLRKEPGIVVVFLGDGALETGVFHESANFAALHKLPVVFVCENNGFSCQTPLSLRQAFIIDRLAKAYGLATFQLDSSKLPLIKDIMLRARDATPAFLELRTQRYYEHCGPKKIIDMPFPYKTEPAWARDIGMEVLEAFRLAEVAPEPKYVGMYAR